VVLLLLFVKEWHPENQILGPNSSTECPKGLFKTLPRGVQSKSNYRRSNKDTK